MKTMNERVNDAVARVMRQETEAAATDPRAVALVNALTAWLAKPDATAYETLRAARDGAAVSGYYTSPAAARLAHIALWLDRPAWWQTRHVGDLERFSAPPVMS